MQFSSEIINLAAQAIIALLGLGCLWLLSKAGALLRVRIDSEETTEIVKLVYQIVAAAEQQFKKDDPNGSKRKQYVINLLTEMGFKITEELNALIEAAVFELNLEQKNEAAE